MRVGILRGDMPGPVFLADLEPVSQCNFSTETIGQTRYVSRPDLTSVTRALSVIPAGLKGTVDISGVISIAVGLGSSDTIKIKTAAAAPGWTNAVVAAATYTSATTLLVAVNAALVAAGIAATASLDPSGTYFVLKSTATGTGAYIAVDSVAGGSDFDTAIGLAVAGGTFTVPTTVATITDTLPVGGPLNVSAAQMLTTVGPGPSTVQLNALRDTIAPQFIETDVAIRCFQVGYLAELRNANFNPDPSRHPALTPSAAVTFVQDDGTTAFASSTAALVPNITNAQLNTPTSGWVTITGTGLANSEHPMETTVQFLDESHLPGSHEPFPVYQDMIVAAGGSVSLTSIVIPPALRTHVLVPTWAVATTTKVRVKRASLVSNKRAF